MTELREKDVQIILEKYGAHEMAKAKGYAYQSIGMPQSQATKALMALINRTAPVVVKELEWQDAKDASYVRTPVGRYEVLEMTMGSYWIVSDSPKDGPSHRIEYETRAAAKAACQADYTRRILSAVNAVSETRIAVLEAEVAHLRRVEAGAVRQAEELAAMRGVVEAAESAHHKIGIARGDVDKERVEKVLGSVWSHLGERLAALTKAEG